MPNSIAGDGGAGPGGHGDGGAIGPRRDADAVVHTGAGDVAVGGDGQRAAAVIEGKNSIAVSAGAHGGAGPGGHGEIGARVHGIDAGAEGIAGRGRGPAAGAGDVAVGGDGQRAAALVVGKNPNAVVADGAHGGAGPGGYGEIGALVHCMDAIATIVILACDIAVGSYAQRAGAVIDGIDAVGADGAHGSAGAGGHGEIGAMVTGIDAVSTGWTIGGDIAIGGDAHRAAAVIARENAVAPDQHAAGDHAHAAGVAAANVAAGPDVEGGGRPGRCW